MKNKIYFCILVLLYSCGPENKEGKNEQGKDHIQTQLENFKWLVGSWSNITPEAQLYEIWRVENDSSLFGESYMIVERDTTFYETIRLEARGNEVFYIPNVSGQNNNQPVSFKMVADSSGEFIFENLQHDFPQRIVYNNSEADVLNARIEGQYEGQFRKEEFVMNKEYK